MGEENGAVKNGQSAPPAVRLTGIAKRFGHVQAVEKMNLDIEEGSLVTLLGPSGCGKTTILRMIAGLETPTEGDIFIRGQRVNQLPIYKRNLGMIFQNYALFPHKTIFENVAFGLKYRNVPKAEIKDKVRWALEMVRLPGVENRNPSQLSGGQQQRIAMARAIVIEPVVLLMDEPLSALDEKLREEMRREVDNLQREIGITTVFVTHDQREALSMSDKIVVMKSGRIQQEGGPEDVYNRPANQFVADFLGHSNFFIGRVEGQSGDMLRLGLDDGAELLVDDGGDWSEGDRVRVVIRAQKYQIYSRGDYEPEEGNNYFHGQVVDRSYMGGETSYFIKLDSGTVIHVISLVKRTPYRRGDEVSVMIGPSQCHLLSEDDDSMSA